MSLMEQRTTCSALNKRGEPCRAIAVGENGLCNVHDPDSPVSARFLTGINNGGGRPSKIEEWRQEVVADWSSWTRPFVKARDGDDAALAIKASNDVMDRVFGKAVQRSEVSGPDGGVIPVWLQVVGEVVPVVEVEDRS